MSGSEADERVLREAAGKAGHSVMRVSDLREARAKARKVQPALVICDTDVEGGRHWRAILEESTAGAFPSVIASRVPTEALWAEVLNLGGFDVLTVPFDRAELDYVLLSALRHSSHA